MRCGCVVCVNDVDGNGDVCGVFEVENDVMW